MRYIFDTFVVDDDAMTLVVDGESRSIQPQVFDVLRLLIEERHRLVTKEELLDRVWGHNFVTESALTSRIKSARQAIGDDGREQRLIRTVHGRGYQFIGSVTVEHGDAGSTPGPGPTPLRARPLPVFVSELVGRDRELQSLANLVERSRFVTVTGPGGVGKTRVAVAVASASHQMVGFADLTMVRDASLVLPHIASELGLHGFDDALAAISEFVSGRDFLLVVDNVEHVIDAAIDLAQLVGRATDLTVLATSRERLRVDGEQIFVLDPLAIDTSTDVLPAAVALFVDTARAVAPELDLERYRRHVDRICSTVDGLPLAIELVASQTRTLPPDILASRLDDRLQSAGAMRRDSPERHRTMAATIEWSLRLLERDEKLLFARLGAFVGDASISMIEAVCQDEQIPNPVDLLSRLVDKSLVRSRVGPDGELGFGMLELLRAHAIELLVGHDQRDDLGWRHAQVVADRVEAIDRDRWGELVSTWPDAMTRLLPEFRRADDWAAEHGDWELAGRLSASFAAFWHREGGLAEGRRRLGRVLDHEADVTEHTLARVLAASSIVSWDSGDVLAARHTWVRAADLLERLDEPSSLASALAGIAITTLDEPDLHDSARSLLDRAVTLARGSDRPGVLTEVLNMRGEFARGTGDDALARASYTETARLATEIGDGSMEGVALANLLYIECHEGNFEQARRIGRTALRACRARGRRLMAAWSVGELAIPACGLGELVTAARLLGASQRAVSALGGGRYPADVAEDERVVADLIDRMGRESFERHLTEGEALTLDEAIALALGENGPSRT